ncbi:hypothetical protein LINGRAPRIM_LOCUS2717, partial [Linum grandiflorum]
TWQVEVSFSGADGKEEDTKAENPGSGVKILPPWMIRQGMNITQEQRGETKHESKMDGVSSSGFSNDKKSAVADEEQSRQHQNEYFKAYYAALLKQHQEQEAARKQVRVASSS